MWIAAFGIASMLALVVGTLTGAARVRARDLPQALRDPAHPAHHVLWSVRLPRMATAVAVGASLAVSGALLQAVVRNPLADPGIMGVTTGAGVGGVLAIVGFPDRPGWRAPCALVGAAVALALVMGSAWLGTRRVEPLRLVLTGVAVQAILFAVLALLMFFFADRAPAFVAFTIGSLNGMSWHEARLTTATALGGTLGAVVGYRAFDLLLLDDDSAESVGLSIAQARIGGAALAAVLAAGVASAAGLVGFIGLVVPNFARVLLGPSHGALLPACILGGATLAVVADTAARTVAAPLELPVGALLALVGGPYFLFIIRRRLV